MSITNTISKRDYLRQKFENFKRFIESKTPSDFEPNEEIERFKAMTEEDIISFAVSHLYHIRIRLIIQLNRFVKCLN